ncbi:magnesium transporter CorA family protein [Candidatus Woesearchaeota archaeon]|nr:magnesium transporter CorA family protein [Candidatus Woesearchaeota archaeon]
MIELFQMQAEKIERLEHLDLKKTKEFIDSAGKGTVWIRVIRPENDEIGVLAELTSLSVDEFKESIEEEERSRVSVNKHLKIVYSSPSKEGDEILTSPIYIYAYGNQVITIERGPNKILSDLSTALLENKRKFLFKKPIGYFIFYILDKVNDEFLHFIDRISVRIDLFKDYKALSNQNIQKIYDSSISLSYFNQAIIANIEVLNELRKSYYKLLSHDDRKHFSELYFDALQILDTEKIQRELLSNLFNMQSTIASNELNYFMKIVALVALLSTLPNIITSIFSMNVKNVPIVSGDNAFYVLLGLIVFSSAISYLIYKIFEKR